MAHTINSLSKCRDHYGTSNKPKLSLQSIHLTFLVKFSKLCYQNIHSRDRMFVIETFDNNLVRVAMH